MLETLEVRRITDSHTPIKPHQSKQLSTVMVCHIQRTIADVGAHKTNIYHLQK
jgi:hypothetical protein